MSRAVIHVTGTQHTYFWTSLDGGDHVTSAIEAGKSTIDVELTDSRDQATGRNVILNTAHIVAVEFLT